MRKAILAVLLLAVGSAIARGQSVRGVWVTTDCSADTSSTKAIVSDLAKPGMTDEQKVLAIFNWYRRVVYPHNYLLADRRDVLRQINSYGNTLCGSHAANLGWLMREAGFKTRCTFIRGGGHTFIEVFYDGGWHAVDPETDFAVWSRGEKPHLISMEELKADSTLLDNAEAEGRARPWLFKAMKFPWAVRKTMADYCDKNHLDKAAMQWSSSVLKGETIKDYFVEGVKTLKYSEVNATYGGEVSDPDLMKIELRPNERLVRRWSNEGQGAWIGGAGFEGYPAMLLYGGGADENDAEVFPYVEPYRQDNYGMPALPVDRCYRYSGNGHLVWQPTLQQLAAAGGVKLDGAVIDRDGGPMRAADASKPGTVTIPFRSSYALIGCRIKATWAGGQAGRLAILAGKEAREIAPSTQPDEGATEYSVGKAINGKYAWKLQIELPREGGLKAIAFDHTLANNWLALPYLQPGESTVRVRLDNPEVLKQVELFVNYRWADGEGWKDEHSETREVTGSPFEFKLNAVGPKYPRMKELTLSVRPR
ncbi:MAG: hypothetical protein BIFFINMI_03336 [Phycisphaerae bacterium]|nr:hypothetical protein [Phycisphaerae bacterium]